MLKRLSVFSPLLLLFSLLLPYQSKAATSESWFQFSTELSDGDYILTTLEGVQLKYYYLCEKVKNWDYSVSLNPDAFFHPNPIRYYSLGPSDTPQIQFNGVNLYNVAVENNESLSYTILLGLPTYTKYGLSRYQRLIITDLTVDGDYATPVVTESDNNPAAFVGQIDLTAQRDDETGFYYIEGKKDGISYELKVRPDSNYLTFINKRLNEGKRLYIANKVPEFNTEIYLIPSLANGGDLELFEVGYNSPIFKQSKLFKGNYSIAYAHQNRVKAIHTYPGVQTDLPFGLGNEEAGMIARVPMEAVVKVKGADGSFSEYAPDDWYRYDSQGRITLYPEMPKDTTIRITLSPDYSYAVNGKYLINETEVKAPETKSFVIKTDSKLKFNTNGFNKTEIWDDFYLYSLPWTGTKDFTVISLPFAYLMNYTYIYLRGSSVTEDWRPLFYISPITPKIRDYHMNITEEDVINDSSKWGFGTQTLIQRCLAGFVGQRSETWVGQDDRKKLLYYDVDLYQLPQIEFDIEPFEPSVTQPEGVAAHAAFSEEMWETDGEGNHSGVEGSGITVPLTAVGMSDAIHPDWGTWKAVITPTFEGKSLEDYMQSHGWATEAMDRWHDPDAILESYSCHVEENMLIIDEFRPSCSGTYHLELSYTPKDYPEDGSTPDLRYYPVNPGKWEFDFNVYPDISGLQLGYWNGTGSNGMFEFSETDEFSGQWTGPGADHAGWKRINVQPKGGYVDIWWRDHNASHNNAKLHRAPVDDMNLSPEEQGYQKMDSKYIDASNIDNLDIMLSKNGAVNPTYATLTLNRDASLLPVGIDAPEISDEEAPELWFTLDGRVAVIGTDGLPALPGIYVTASGRKITRR